MPIYVCTLHLVIQLVEKDHAWQVICPTPHILFSKCAPDERNCYLFVNASAWNSCTALYRGKMK